MEILHKRLKYFLWWRGNYIHSILKSNSEYVTRYIKLLYERLAKKNTAINAL